MKRLYYAAIAYTALGLIAGLFYREYTESQDFTGDSQLSTTHTHLLVLGTLFFLIVLALEKLFSLSGSRWFGPFFWTYNVGLLLTVAMMITHGIMTVRGEEDVSAAIPGIAGLGHIIMTVGLIFFFIVLGGRIADPDHGDGRTRVSAR